MYEHTPHYNTQQWIRNYSWDAEDYTKYFMPNTFIDHDHQIMTEVAYQWIELNGEPLEKSR